jgi:hypothetical protein
MTTNLSIYNKLKTPPKEALKTIGAGRLKGMTDIKPQWRILAMTEQFGPCGIGWFYDDVIFDYQHTASGEVVCNCRLKLFIKVDGEWSQPIVGTGGSKLIAQESKGLYVSDEAEKMAMTDALSVAMKAIGVAGDIYLGYSDSKYNTSEKKETNLAPIQDTLSSINTIEELQSFWKENEAEFSKNIQIIKLIEAKKQELKK